MSQDEQPPLLVDRQQGFGESHFIGNPFDRPQAGDVHQGAGIVGAIQLNAIQPEQGIRVVIQVCLGCHPMVGAEEEMVTRAGVHLRQFNKGFAAIGDGAVDVSITFVPVAGQLVAKFGHHWL